MNALLSRYKQLPRAAQWLVLLCLFVGGFFAIVQPMLNIAERYGARADRLENAITRHNALTSRDSSDGGFLASAQSVYGRPKIPGDSVVKPETLYRIVSGILETHGVTSRTIRESRAPLGDSIRGLNGTSLDRFSLVVSFEAPSEVVMAVLTDLERTPEIISVSQVKLDALAIRPDAPDDAIAATLTPEAWIISQASEVGGSGGGSRP